MSASTTSTDVRTQLFHVAPGGPGTAALCGAAIPTDSVQSVDSPAPVAQRCPACVGLSVRSDFEEIRAQVPSHYVRISGRLRPVDVLPPAELVSRGFYVGDDGTIRRSH